MAQGNKLIDIQRINIFNRYGKTLVRNVSFDVNEGEIVGVVGESGSGKTLTARAIVNLLPSGLTYSAEKFNVLGEDYLSLSENNKRLLIGKKIGFVPQNTVFYLHPMIKIKRQISDGYRYFFKASKEDALERATELLEKVGFRDTKRLLNSFSWQLSGGMRQRVNIAMAMMNNPKLILADEPTTALDSTIQRQVMEFFKGINQEHNTSILVISHDLGLVKSYCSKILVMYAGRIVEAAPTEELFENPCHPYTKALIRVIPTLNIKKGERLKEIPGFVPEMGRQVDGCIFRDRCDYAKDECEIAVKKTYINDNHYYRCNFKI